MDYITKPFHLKEVLARVETHLGLRNLQQELERANESIAEQRDTLDTVLRNVADGLVFTDHRGNILLTNPTFDQILPDPPEQLEGTALSQVLPSLELSKIIGDALQSHGNVHTIDVILSDQRIFRASACGLGRGDRQATGAHQDDPPPAGETHLCSQVPGALAGNSLGMESRQETTSR